MKKLYTFVGLFFLIKICAAQYAASLDTTFNHSGIATFTMPAQTLPQIGSKHVLQPDGKIIICTNAITGDFVSDIIVARYKPNGTLDSTFGTNGIFNHSLVTGLNLAIGLQVQPDGKIVTAGTFSSLTDETDNRVFILRLNNNGTPDPAFGSAGISRWNFSPDDERVTDMKRMPDGGFVITGYIVSSVSSDSGFIVKTTSNGLLDSNFAANGFFSYQHNESQTDLYAIDVLPDNSVIAGGSYSSEDNYQDIFLLKLDSLGTLDSSFASSGIFTQDLFNDYDEVHSLKVLSNGNILAAGYSYNGLNDGSMVIKLDSAGHNVNSFGTNSVSYFVFPNTASRAYAMDVQANSKIVLAGEYSDPVSFSYNVLVLRLLASGTPDSSFNNSLPYVTTDILASDDEAFSVLIQPDQKIVVYGTALDPNFSALPSLIRYMGNAASGPLALDLISFTGTALPGKNSLQWTTANEIDNDYFAIEKSVDGNSFKDIARVYAKKYSSSTNYYNYTDNNILSLDNFYRLRITDKARKIVHSKIILLTAKNQNGVLVYPTFVTSNLHIETAVRNPALFRLYNSAGQLVKKLISGDNNLSSLAKGTYYLMVTGEVIRIVKE